MRLIVKPQSDFGFIGFVTSQAMITVGDRVEHAVDVREFRVRFRAFCNSTMIQKYKRLYCFWKKEQQLT